MWQCPCMVLAIGRVDLDMLIYALRMPVHCSASLPSCVLLLCLFLLFDGFCRLVGVSLTRVEGLAVRRFSRPP